jgi:hypothetical protein
MAAFLFYPFRIIHFGGSKPPFDHFQFDLRRRYAPLRFLLEGVQNVDGGVETNGLDGAIRVTVEIIDELNSAASEPLERLRRRRMLPSLREK